jgi:hypothetical protein
MNLITSKSHDTQSQLANHHLISLDNENTSNALHKIHKSHDVNNLIYVKRFNINKSVYDTFTSMATIKCYH